MGMLNKAQTQTGSRIGRSRRGRTPLGQHTTNASMMALVTTARATDEAAPALLACTFARHTGQRLLAPAGVHEKV